ncbi:MAG: DUF4430 domain-containing protein [Finegoldia magna]|nr:DUF4430 domain-containing protein [Finegoldia magna]MDD6907070.1 DUF4430 domain-containing protein [Finegoldia magna]
MKKKLLVLMMIVFSLTACNADKDKAQEPQKTEQTQEQAKTDENKTEEKASESEATKVSIVVMDEVNNKEILKEDAEIKKDENLQSYLEKNHKAVFEKGMMTELEGVKQAPAKKQYWMYYVNDKMAEVGIGDYKVNENDKIEIKFQEMK